MIEKKQCKKCLAKKPLTDFGKNDKGRNGLQSRCKQCITDYAREKRQNSTSPNPKRAIDSPDGLINIVIGKVASKHIRQIAKHRKSTIPLVVNNLLHFAITTYTHSQDKLIELAEIEREKHMQEVGFLREPNTTPLGISTSA